MLCGEDSSEPHEKFARSDGTVGNLSEYGALRVLECQAPCRMTAFDAYHSPASWNHDQLRRFTQQLKSIPPLRVRRTVSWKSDYADTDEKRRGYLDGGALDTKAWMLNCRHRQLIHTASVHI